MNLTAPEQLANAIARVSQLEAEVKAFRATVEAQRDELRDALQALYEVVQNETVMTMHHHPLGERIRATLRKSGVKI
jgi:hypothetical protein